MVKTNNLLLAFCAGACIVLSLSMNKAQLEPQLVLVDKLNYSDTIYQNDSMFSILKFENGRLAKIQLKQFIDSRKIKTFGIQTISFYDNGRIHQLKSTCRDTVLTNGSIAYEEQTLIGKLPRFSDNLKLLNLNCFTYEKIKIYRSPDCENSERIRCWQTNKGLMS